MEVENRLRKFVSEILNPFNDRIGVLNKDVKALKQSNNETVNQMTHITAQMHAATLLKESVIKMNTEMHQIVSNYVYNLVNCRNPK